MNTRPLLVLVGLGGLVPACFLFPSNSSGGSGGTSTATSMTAGTGNGDTTGSTGQGGAGGAFFGSGSGGANTVNDGGLPDMCAGGTVGGTRPATVRTFAKYDCTKPAPLVVLLHDYASSGDQAEQYFGLDAQADALGFLYVHPDGTTNTDGKQFWNATDACCNQGGSTVDDSGYLSELIWDIRAQYNVDPKRVYVFGYGNGGFMAYRMACDHADQITAVADLAGATWDDLSKCPLKTPMSVLEIHGTSDSDFAYGGGTNLGFAYPSAATTVADWVALDHCKSAGVAGTALDLDSSIAGAETTVTTWSGCPGLTGMALWSIQGGTHTPTLSPGFSPAVMGFLLGKSKP